MLTESSVMFFSPSRAVLSAIWRDEYLTSAVRTSLVLTAEVKYSSRKITLKTARDGEKTWHMTQLTFSSNFCWKICSKFCSLEQIIATVLFICISSINKTPKVVSVGALVFGSIMAFYVNLEKLGKPERCVMLWASMSRLPVWVGLMCLWLNL